jgi:hypothetical protein
VSPAAKSSWCLENPSSTACTRFIEFKRSAEPQTLTIPVAHFASQRQSLPLVILDPRPAPPVLEVLMDGQPASCTDLYGPITCEAPLDLAELRVVVPSADVAFRLTIDFKEAICTERTRACAV